MIYDINQLVAEGCDIRNVFTDNSVGTAKQPCLVDKRTMEQKHHIGGYKTKTQEYFNNTLVIHPTCSYGLHCGRQEKGKFIIALDWDIYDRTTGLEDEPTTVAEPPSAGGARRRCLTRSSGPRAGPGPGQAVR